MASTYQFVRDENGAAVIDWITLASAVLVLGLVVVYSIFNVGVASVSRQVESALGDVQIAGGTGPAPNFGNNAPDAASALPPIGAAGPVGSGSAREPVAAAAAAKPGPLGEARAAGRQ